MIGVARRRPDLACAVEVCELRLIIIVRERRDGERLNPQASVPDPRAGRIGARNHRGRADAGTACAVALIALDVDAGYEAAAVNADVAPARWRGGRCRCLNRLTTIRRGLEQ